MRGNDRNTLGRIAQGGTSVLPTGESLYVVFSSPSHNITCVLLIANQNEVFLNEL